MKLLLKKDYLELVEEYEKYADRDIYKIYVTDDQGNKTLLAQNDIYTSSLMKFAALHEILSKTLNW